MKQPPYNTKSRHDRYHQGKYHADCMWCRMGVTEMEQEYTGECEV